MAVLILKVREEHKFIMWTCDHGGCELKPWAINFRTLQQQKQPLCQVRGFDRFLFCDRKKPTNTSTVYMRLISLHDQVLLVKRVQIDLNYMSFIHLQTRWVLIILQLWIYSMKKHFVSWPFSQPSIMLTQRLGEVIFVCNVNVRFWQLSRDDGLILYRLNGFVLSSTHNILCVSETSSGILYILVEEGVGRGASEPWTKADSAGDKSLLLLKGSFFFSWKNYELCCFRDSFTKPDSILVLVTFRAKRFELELQFSHNSL